MTDEMLRRFAVRTLHHISLVGKNLLRMEGYAGLERSELEARAREHDRSKFDEHESPGYIWLTWVYHCKETGRPFEITPEISATIERALQLHRGRNAHHPEAHPAPDAMSVIDLVEMVCDWTAIAQEKDGVGSARLWANENISRWQFSRSVRDFIYRTIDVLDRKNAVEQQGLDPCRGD